MILNKYMENKKDICAVGGYGNLDILKILLALLIVLRHIGQYFLFNNVFWHVYIINTISTIGVTSFFIMSGFLLFRKPVGKERLKKQIFRILKLYGCWTIVYLPLDIYKYLKDGLNFPQAIVDFVQKAIFEGTYYHMWYLPSLIVAICIVYIMKNRRCILITVTAGLMIIGIFTDTYGISFPKVYYTIFLTTRNGLFMGSFLVAVGKCLADYESKLKNLKKWKLILPVAIVALYVEGGLISKFDSERIINIAFTSVIVSIILVTIMIGLPQIKASKNVRNMSTVIYLCHPCIMVIINLSDHLGIFLNAGVKSFISMIMSILAALAVVKLSNKFKIIDNFM